jgi:DNA-binding MarR family transcriptional regulator
MDFFTALVRYEIELWGTVDAALHEGGRISLAQLQAVEIVDAHGGGVRVLDISGEIGITIGAASKLVDRLERDGLAVRAPNPNDRRSSLIALTKNGQSALQAAAEVRDDVLRAAISEDAQRSASRVLVDLQRQLDDYRNEAAA